MAVLLAPTKRDFIIRRFVGPAFSHRDPTELRYNSMQPSKIDRVSRLATEEGAYPLSLHVRNLKRLKHWNLTVPCHVMLSLTNYLMYRLIGLLVHTAPT